jgi:histidyl-tRNA synthetase
MIHKVKGTQDLLNMNLYDALYNALYNHFTRAHFNHIQTPILEHEALFKRSVGQETDIVGKEMYTLSTNDKETLCLRPEGTASTIRAYLESGLQTTPWNVFSHGPMFRHERPQKGRWRQFSQFNIEAVGIQSLAQEVRFINLLNDFFSRTLKLEAYVLSINFLGSRHDRMAHKEALKQFLTTHSNALCATCSVRATTNILRIFDCKHETCQTLYTTAPRITDYLSEESAAEWATLNSLLDMLSINRIHNPLLVRGLDYYNNIVFEFSSSHLGAQSTFCGGGQYDLSAAFERKEPLPSLGAAIGMERLLLLLEATQNTALTQQQPDRIGILAFDESLKPLALLAHQTLHRAGHHTDILVGGIKKGMKKANAAGLTWLVLIGETERVENVVRIKNMSTGEETVVAQERLVEFFTA